MQLIEKTTAEIDKIFKIINVVYDQSILSFDPIETVTSNFKEAFNLSCGIDLTGLIQELLSDENEGTDFDEILFTIETEFHQIINWKQGISDIVKIKDVQRNDMVGYFNKLNQLEVRHTVQQKDILIDIFIKTGLRLLKVKIDITKIIAELKNIRELQEKINQLSKDKAAGYNIMLAPDKLHDFTILLFNMFENNFFKPIDYKNPISEVDIIWAFENFFDVDITNSEWFTPDMYFQGEDKTQFSNKKLAPAPELSPEMLKKELSAYFKNIPDNYFYDYIKDEFKTEKGKNIAILIYVLKNYDPALLEIPNGKLKKFYMLLKSFFNTDIGTYQSIANYSVDKYVHKAEIDSMKNRLEIIKIL